MTQLQNTDPIISVESGHPGQDCLIRVQVIQNANVYPKAIALAGSLLCWSDDGYQPLYWSHAWMLHNGAILDSFTALAIALTLHSKTRFDMGDMTRAELWHPLREGIRTEIELAAATRDRRQHQLIYVAGLSLDPDPLMQRLAKQTADFGMVTDWRG